MPAPGRLAAWGVLLLAAVLAGGAPVAGQDRPGGGAPWGGLELGGLVSVGLPVSFGASDANLDRSSGGTLALFSTSSREGVEPGLRIGLGRRLVGPLSLTGEAGWGRAILRTRVTGDYEGAEAVTVEEHLSRFTLEGGVAWRVHGTARSDWFVAGAGGWRREVSGSHALAVGGAVAHLGAGVKYWWPLRGGRRRVGLQAEARLVSRWHGVTLDDDRVHLASALVAGFIIGP